MQKSDPRLCSGKRPVRVLINALHSKTGGGVTYLTNIVPLLSRDPEIEIHIVLHANQLDRYDWLSDFSRLHPFSFKDDMITTLAWEQIMLPIIKRMMRADVIYSPANYGPLLGGKSVILMRNSLEVAAKEVRLDKIVYWIGVGLLTALSILFATKIVAVSNYTVSYLRRWPLKFLCKKLTVVNHGVSPIFKQGDQKREDFILAVGDIYIQKNYHVLIKAFAEISKRHPNLRLMIAGKPVDAQYAAELTNSIAAFGLQDKILMLGHVDSEKLRSLYVRCALFVFPSTVETFGNPLVEALASGAPVACSNRTAMPEIAGDAVAYFDPEDVTSMAGTIDGLLRDKGYLKELSRRALARGSLFSWDTSATRLAAVLKQAAE